MTTISDFVAFELPSSNLNECTVCLEEMDGFSNVAPIVRLMCEHEFHQKCLRALNRDARNDMVTCPVCRKFVTFRTPRCSHDQHALESTTQYTRGVYLLGMYCLLITLSFMYMQFVYENVSSETTADT
jgi:hypothetical protein